MASYGNIFEFSVYDINGDDVDIFISKKNYAGSSIKRALGRAPILKRERSGNILGTSLEIYAECKVDGEFAQLYTSSADEFLVEVYKRQILQWRGFVSPELYSEPDIAPPYDVQIIATDGLGELKNHRFDSQSDERPLSFLGHMRSILGHTGLECGIEFISGLQYYEDGWGSDNNLQSILIDLKHLSEETCYDVLQAMLSSVNACITQQMGEWLIIRESDLYNERYSLNCVSFGSMNSCEWWPIGNLSTDIIPAKKSLSLVSENHYKDTVLENSFMSSDAGWTKETDAYYNVTEQGYTLPSQYSSIGQKVSFFSEVGYKLLLHISARSLGDGEAPQYLGVIIKINGRMYFAGSEFWLKKLAAYDNKYAWDTDEGAIEIELPASSDSDTRTDAKDIDIIIPLYKYDDRSYAYATSVEVALYNMSGSQAICIYECSLSQYDRSGGKKVLASIANGAREIASQVDLAFNDGEYSQGGAEVFRRAIPLGYDTETIIKRWVTPSVSEGSYLSVMAKDYAMQVALPRMRYRGKLNVPSQASPEIPLLFSRDSTYYFLNTYSYDLLNSELEVELISIPNASVVIESETIIEIPMPGSSLVASSGGGSGSGGGGEGGGSITVDSAMSDISTNPVQNKVIKAYTDDAKQDAIDVSAAFTVESINGMKEYWFDDAMSDDSNRGVRNYVIKAYVDGKYNELAFLKSMFYWADEAHTVIGTKYPFFSESTLTAGGRKTEEDSGGSGGGITITDVADYLEQQGYATEQWVINKDYATNSALKSLSDKVDGLPGTDVDLTGYATEQWVKDQKYATEEALKSLSDKVDGLPGTDVDLTGYATEQWVKDQGYVTSTSLEATFSGIDTRLKALEKLLDLFEFDETAQMIKAKFGIYSVGAITAAKKEEEE